MGFKEFFGFTTKEEGVPKGQVPSPKVEKVKSPRERAGLVLNKFGAMVELDPDDPKFQEINKRTAEELLDSQMFFADETNRIEQEFQKQVESITDPSRIGELRREKDRKQAIMRQNSEIAASNLLEGQQKAINQLLERKWREKFGEIEV